MNLVYYHMDGFGSEMLNQILLYFYKFGDMTSINSFLMVYTVAFLTVIIYVVYHSVVNQKVQLQKLMQKIIWQDWKHNFFTVFLKSLLLYVILLSPIPVVQVSPIVSANQQTQEVDFLGWSINSSKTFIKDGNTETNKLYHLPLVIAIPLKYIEYLYYGIPDFSAGENGVEFKNDTDFTDAEVQKTKDTFAIPFIFTKQTLSPSSKLTTNRCTGNVNNSSGYIIVNEDLSKYNNTTKKFVDEGGPRDDSANDCYLPADKNTFVPNFRKASAAVFEDFFSPIKRFVNITRTNNMIIEGSNQKSKEMLYISLVNNNLKELNLASTMTSEKKPVLRQLDMNLTLLKMLRVKQDNLINKVKITASKIQTIHNTLSGKKNIPTLMNIKLKSLLLLDNKKLFFTNGITIGSEFEDFISTRDKSFKENMTPSYNEELDSSNFSNGDNISYINETFTGVNSNYSFKEDGNKKIIPYFGVGNSSEIISYDKGLFSKNYDFNKLVSNIFIYNQDKIFQKLKALEYKDTTQYMNLDKIMKEIENSTTSSSKSIADIRKNLKIYIDGNIFSAKKLESSLLYFYAIDLLEDYVNKIDNETEVFVRNYLSSNRISLIKENNGYYSLSNGNDSGKISDEVLTDISSLVSEDLDNGKVIFGYVLDKWSAIGIKGTDGKFPVIDFIDDSVTGQRIINSSSNSPQIFVKMVVGDKLFSSTNEYDISDSGLKNVKENGIILENDIDINNEDLNVLLSTNNSYGSFDNIISKLNKFNGKSGNILSLIETTNYIKHGSLAFETNQVECNYGVDFCTLLNSEVTKLNKTSEIKEEIAKLNYFSWVNFHYSSMFGNMDDSSTEMYNDYLMVKQAIRGLLLININSSQNNKKLLYSIFKSGQSLLEVRDGALHLKEDYKKDLLEEMNSEVKEIEEAGIGTWLKEEGFSLLGYDGDWGKAYQADLIQKVKNFEDGDVTYELKAMINYIANKSFLEDRIDMQNLLENPSRINQQILANGELKFSRVVNNDFLSFTDKNLVTPVTNYIQQYQNVVVSKITNDFSSINFNFNPEFILGANSSIYSYNNAETANDQDVGTEKISGIGEFFSSGWDSIVLTKGGAAIFIANMIIDLITTLTYLLMVISLVYGLVLALVSQYIGYLLAFAVFGYFAIFRIAFDPLKDDESGIFPTSIFNEKIYYVVIKNMSVWIVVYATLSIAVFFVDTIIASMIEKAQIMLLISYIQNGIGSFSNIIFTLSVVAFPLTITYFLFKFLFSGDKSILMKFLKNNVYDDTKAFSAKIHSTVKKISEIS